MAPRARTRTKPEPSISDRGALELVAAVLGNLSRLRDRDELQRALEALRQVLLDWQVAYHTLDAQLALALRTNEQNGRLIALLREELRRTQARAALAEARALEARAGRDPDRARSSMSPKSAHGGAK